MVAANANVLRGHYEKAVRNLPLEHNGTHIFIGNFNSIESSLGFLQGALLEPCKACLYLHVFFRTDC